MLLRHITEHVKAQNWTAVALDFMIVVVGVFIGIQVSNWNAARATETRERAYIAQLSEDVAAMEIVLKRRMDALSGVQEAQVRMLRSLEACAPDLASRDDFEKSLTSYQNVIAIQVIDATYKDMLASGAFSGITDAKLRAAIGAFFSSLHSINELTPMGRSALPTVDSIVWKRVALSYDQDGAPILAEFDFEALCDDLEFRNAVVEMIDMQNDWANTAGIVLASLQEIKEKLQSHNGDA